MLLAGANPSHQGRRSRTTWSFHLPYSIAACTISIINGVVTVITHPSLEGTKDMNKAFSTSPFLPVNHSSYSFLVFCYRSQVSDQVPKSVCTLQGTEQTLCKHFYGQKSVIWLPTTEEVGLACKRNFFQSHIPIHTNTQVSALPHVTAMFCFAYRNNNCLDSMNPTLKLL